MPPWGVVSAAEADKQTLLGVSPYRNSVLSLEISDAVPKSHGTLFVGLTNRDFAPPSGMGTALGREKISKISIAGSLDTELKFLPDDHPKPWIRSAWFACLCFGKVPR